MIGILGAMCTVVVTTLDDAIWLVPYVGSPSLPFATRCCHAMLFVTTLTGLSLVCVVSAMIVSRGGSHLLSGHHNDNHDTSTSASQQEQDDERVSIILGMLGATLCWIIAATLFIKKLCKKRRRYQQQQQHQEAKAITTTNNTESYGSVEVSLDGDPEVHNNDDNAKNNNNDNDADEREIPQQHPSPWTVISLTTLGALDEISYFPTLILGRIFTPLDLCLGTLLAAGVVLLIVTCFLQPCKPLLHWLDQIPLYGIVAMFATVLTLNTLWDWMHS